jgi:uncharacterized phage-associated protein
MSPRPAGQPVWTSLHLDLDKAIETILYVARSLPERSQYWVLKAIYFADKRHLQRYGRFIFGEDYVAMEQGPVPSGAYDLVKAARGLNPWCQEPEGVGSAFSMRGNYIIPLRDPDLDVFSKSDLECLDEAIEEVRPLSFGELKARSHDAAHEGSDENAFISVESIASLFPNRDELLEYLRDPYPSD